MCEKGKNDPEFWIKYYAYYKFLIILDSFVGLRQLNMMDLSLVHCNKVIVL